MLPHIVAFFQPCSFGLAISVFACRVLFVLIYSVPARTIHPRFVLAHSVQHYSVRSLSRLQIQFSYQFLLRSFLSSIFPSVSVSQSLCLSGLPCTIFSVQSKPLGHSFYVFQFSLCHKATKFDFFRSVQASRFPLFYFLFCPCLTPFQFDSAGLSMPFSASSRTIRAVTASPPLRIGIGSELSLTRTVILGQNVVLFFETRREVRWRIEPYQKADVRYRIFVLLQKIGRIG